MERTQNYHCKFSIDGQYFSFKAVVSLAYRGGFIATVPNLQHAVYNHPVKLSCSGVPVAFDCTPPAVGPIYHESGNNLGRNSYSTFPITRKNLLVESFWISYQ